MNQQIIRTLGLFVNLLDYGLLSVIYLCSGNSGQYEENVQRKR